MIYYEPKRTYTHTFIVYAENDKLLMLKTYLLNIIPLDVWIKIICVFISIKNLKLI